MLLHTKYLDSGPCGFRQEYFFCISLCKTLTPGRSHFWPQGYNLNKVDRIPLGDFHISINYVKLIFRMENHMDPDQLASQAI